MRTDIESCFYCHCLVAKNNRELDHFPMPKGCGGTEVVVACKACHDMKDRFRVESWPSELIAHVVIDLTTNANMSRWTRIFVAKMMRVSAEAVAFGKDANEVAIIASVREMLDSGMTLDQVRSAINASAIKASA